MIASLYAVLLSLAADAKAFDSQPVTTPVLLDGLCPDDEWRAAARIELDGAHTLLLMHDAKFAYACILGPSDSPLTLDLYLQGSETGQLYNLHASAQVGERLRGAHGWPPYEWWNHRGWYSPAVPFTGVAGEGEERRPQFMNGRPRELQVQRARFGSGTWRAMLSVGGRRDADGTWQTLVYPAGAKDDDPAGWAEWRFATR